MHDICKCSQVQRRREILGFVSESWATDVGKRDKRMHLFLWQWSFPPCREQQWLTVRKLTMTSQSDRCVEAGKQIVFIATTLRFLVLQLDNTRAVTTCSYSIKDAYTKLCYHDKLMQLEIQTLIRNRGCSVTLEPLISCPSEEESSPLD